MSQSHGPGKVPTLPSRAECKACEIRHLPVLRSASGEGGTSSGTRSDLGVLLQELQYCNQVTLWYLVPFSVVRRSLPTQHGFVGIHGSFPAGGSHHTPSWIHLDPHCSNSVSLGARRFRVAAESPFDESVDVGWERTGWEGVARHGLEHTNMQVPLQCYVHHGP